MDLSKTIQNLDTTNYDECSKKMEEFLSWAHSVDRGELTQAERTSLTTKINIATELKLSFSQEFVTEFLIGLATSIDRDSSAEKKLAVAEDLGNDLLVNFSWNSTSVE